jgi:uncharacterized protein (TIGR02186 family)
MRGALLALLFVIALCIPWPSPVGSGGAAQAEDLVSGISQDLIQITSNYTGTQIVVFGAIERAASAQGRDIVVLVRGPDEPMTVRRRDRVAGVWVNRDAAHFEGLPAYYYLASTQPVSRIAAPGTLARYEIGLGQLRPSAIGSHHDPEPFRQAVIRHLRQSGLYAESPGSIDFYSETLFSTRVPVPAGVARGQYNVEVYLFRGGQMISAQSTPLFVDASGLERRLSNAAHDAPFIYGVACVLMAMLLGWISSVLFQRQA